MTEIEGCSPKAYRACRRTAITLVVVIVLWVIIGTGKIIKTAYNGTDAVTEAVSHGRRGSLYLEKPK